MEYNQAFFLYTAAVKLCDALTVLGVWYACWYLRFNTALFPSPKGLPEFGEYSKISLPLLLVFSAMFHAIGAYRKDRIHFGFRSLKKVVQGAILGSLVFISICYFRGGVPYSRIYLAIFSVLVVVTLVAERAGLQLIWVYAERVAVRKIRILLVGTGELLSMYCAKIQKRQPYPVEWVGRLGEEESLESLSNISHLGNEGELKRLLSAGTVDLVVLSYPTEQNSKYRQVLEALSNELVGIKVLPDFGKYSTFTYSAEQECGIPLLVFNQTPVGNTDRVTKRVFDFAGSFLFILFFSPLYLLIAALIKLTSKGPVIYSQKRMGADGRVFTFYKFSSMRIDAEVRSGPIWAQENDPRVTPLGKWLRKTSLDELPQFFNVLKGDMSLVGPRPERPVFVDQFKQEIPKYMLRHKMKSGITGWAQVNGWRGNTSLEERIKHDLYYIGHWSHYFDIKILCLTVLKGFVNRHAY